MPDYGLDDAVVTSPEETTGQEADKAESKETEVPEDSGETEEKAQDTEETKTDSDNSDEQNPDKEKKEKKYANQFDSLPGMIKSAANLAEALGETVDFDNMKAKDVEDWYVEARKRFSTEGFKGNRSKTNEINKAVKNDEAKLNEFIDDKNKKEQNPQQNAQELVLPQRPEFDWDHYNELLFDDPKAAAKMRKEFEKAKDDYLDKRIEYEAGRLGQGLKPMAEGYQRLTQKEQVEEIGRRGEAAEKNVIAFLQEHFGDETVKEYWDLVPEMKKTGNIDWPIYQAIMDSDPEKGVENAILRLFNNTREKLKLQQLESEMAELRNGKTLEQIQAAKGFAKVSQSTGGTKPKTTGMTAEQAKAKSIAAVRGPSSKYEVVDY